MVIGTEHVSLVDANDKDMGVAEKQEAHVRGLRHRAISVLLLDDDSRVLIQRRAISKYHSAGLWSNTCCGHPRPNELPLDAATRRLREEMGITADLNFKRTFSYRAPLPNGLVENEVVHIFTGRFSGRPAPCDAEVEAWAFVHPDELHTAMRQSPEHYTVWFRLYVDRIPNLLMS